MKRLEKNLIVRSALIKGPTDFTQLQSSFQSSFGDKTDEASSELQSGDFISDRDREKVLSLK